MCSAHDQPIRCDHTEHGNAGANGLITVNIKRPAIMRVSEVNRFTNGQVTHNNELFAATDFDASAVAATATLAVMNFRLVLKDCVIIQALSGRVITVAPLLRNGAVK